MQTVDAEMDTNPTPVTLETEAPITRPCTASLPPKLRNGNAS
jgi:hypothetical protein